MSKGLLDPKVDFVFKNIFGSPNHPEILISCDYRQSWCWL